MEKIIIRKLLINENSVDLQLAPGPFMILVKKVQWEKLVLSICYLPFFISTIYPFKIREKFQSFDKAKKIEKLKSVWNLVSTPRIIQNNFNKHCPWSKIYSEKHPSSYTNSSWCDMLGSSLGVGNAKNQQIFQEQNTTFLWYKKILNNCLRQYILGSYCFVVNVTFKVMKLGTNVH